MRLSIGVTSLFLAGKALGFTDTASFYSSQELDCDFDYITEASALSESVKEFSNNVCSNKQKLTIYRTNNFDAPAQESGVFVKHIHYGSADELDLHLGEACEQDVEYVKYGDAHTDKAITVVDVEQESVSVEDLLSGTGHIIIQGKPSFHTSKLEGLKDYIEDQVYENLNIELEVESSKRETAEEAEAQDDEAEFEKLVEEVENDFKAAESYITKEGNSAVTALASPKASDAPSTDAPKVHVNSNLFTNYQFFTTGLWSCIIVSLVLFFILYTALGWMTSIEISYLSFEKQVDYEKKNE